ncbi:hypothetical protein GCM10010911_20730 [Paenibacillus nasutitermitis]|uniref:Uncharacterized protein n=1 Tax=Paenibacillus nasutitermitis TaxID=1652958 RepID=A0A917DR23_9BACL|nr:hypothetical protein GCM10010911_20730 [Paenibacillus nasutitermitis]
MTQETEKKTGSGTKTMIVLNILLKVFVIRSKKEWSFLVNMCL